MDQVDCVKEAVEHAGDDLFCNDTVPILQQMRTGHHQYLIDFGMFAGELAEQLVVLPAAAYRACCRRRDKVRPMPIYWSHGGGDC